MIGSLRIMHFGVFTSVMVAVLIIGISRDATAQTQGVECPCRFFESVPMTAGCWTDTPSGQVRKPAYTEDPPDVVRACRLRSKNISGDTTPLTEIQAEEDEGGDTCSISVSVLGGPTQACDDPETTRDITPEELKACQCELLAYTTALNEGGISVSPGPPYGCFDVDCTPPPPIITTPIPTLNEYGMIITAGALGLLAVIALFVMRTRRTVAGGRGPNEANQ